MNMTDCTVDIPTDYTKREAVLHVGGPDGSECLLQATDDADAHGWIDVLRSASGNGGAGLAAASGLSSPIAIAGTGTGTGTGTAFSRGPSSTGASSVASGGSGGSGGGGMDQPPQESKPVAKKGFFGFAKRK